MISLNFDKSKALLINYDVINQDFVDKLVEYAKKLGVTDIYLDKNNIKEEHHILKNIALDEIENHPYFNDSIWDKYAKKDASYLILRAPFPGIMDDIDPTKLAKAEYVKRSTKPLYKERQLNFELPWCIAALPNIVWAKNLFKDKDNAYELLEDIIYKICMIDTNNPVDSWNKHLDNNKKRIDELNNLKIKCLHYKNSLGTDLKIELLEDSIWCDAATQGLVNMPSYEIFTSPVPGFKPVTFCPSNLIIDSSFETSLTSINSCNSVALAITFKSIVSPTLTIVFSLCEKSETGATIYFPSLL